jgi:calcium-dependent protein kinase
LQFAGAMGLGSSQEESAKSGKSAQCCPPKVDAHVKEALDRASNRLGKIAISGRYHRLPKHLEQDYDIAKASILGSGYNGDVYLATKMGGGTPLTPKTKFAIKEFKLRGIAENKRLELEQECEVYLGMDHPHVARLVDVYEEQDRLTLVMECMEGGELFDRVIERKKFSEKDALAAAYQMTLAINYLHSHGVVHRDIKLENWLYDQKGSDHLKLIDFGFSKVWEPNIKMKMSCGTLSYVAPEVLAKSYTQACDMWSLGVVLFILLGGYMPFSGPDDQQQANIKAGKYRFKEEKWRGISEHAVNFVKSLMVVDTSVRLTAQQALEHPWMKGEAQMHETAGVDSEVVSSMLAYAQESKFRRACMLAMAWSLSNEERAKVRQAFMDMDKSHQGTVTLAEFRTVLQENFVLENAQIEQAFDALDAAHNHEIQYSDFLAAMVSNRIALHDDLLHDAFRRFDTDNSGFISEENLRDVFGREMTEAELSGMMSEVDANHDGKISYKEFMDYLNKNENHHEKVVSGIDSSLRSLESGDAGERIAFGSTMSMRQLNSRDARGQAMIKPKSGLAFHSAPARSST